MDSDTRSSAGTFSLKVWNNQIVIFRDHQLEVFNRFSSVFDIAVKSVQKTSAEQTQKCQGYYKREFQAIGKVFQQMGQAIQQDGLLRKF